MGDTTNETYQDQSTTGGFKLSGGAVVTGLIGVIAALASFSFLGGLPALLIGALGLLAAGAVAMSGSEGGFGGFVSNISNNVSQALGGKAQGAEPTPSGMDVFVEKAVDSAALVGGTLAAGTGAVVTKKVTNAYSASKTESMLTKADNMIDKLNRENRVATPEELEYLKNTRKRTSGWIRDVSKPYRNRADKRLIGKIDEAIETAENAGVRAAKSPTTRVQVDAESAGSAKTSAIDTPNQSAELGRSQYTTAPDGSLIDETGRPVDVDNAATKINSEPVKPTTATMVESDIIPARLSTTHATFNGDVSELDQTGRNMDEQFKKIADKHGIAVKEGPESLGRNSASEVHANRMAASEMESGITRVAQPKTSKLSSLGGIVAGTSILMNAEGNTTQQVLGTSQIVDGAVEGVAVAGNATRLTASTPAVTRLTAAVPYVTAPVSGVTALYEGQRAIKAFRDGDTETALVSGGNTVVSSSLTANAVGRTAMFRNSALASRLATGGRTATALGAGGQLLSAASNKLLPVLAAKMMYDYVLREEVNGMVADANSAIAGDRKTHSAGIATGYVDKIAQYTYHETSPIFEMEPPDFADYKQLQHGMRIVEKYTDIPKARLENMSVEQIAALIENTQQQLENKKEQALLEVSDSYMGRVSITTSDRELARTPEGRLSLMQTNDARGNSMLHSIVMLGNNYDAEKHKAVKKVDDIDSDLRLVKAAKEELQGNILGYIYGDKRFDSYSNRLQKYEAAKDETAKARAPILAEIKEMGGMDRARESIAELEKIIQELPKDQQANYQQKLAANPDMSALIEQEKIFTQIAQQLPKDEIASYMALAAKQNVLFAKAELVVEIVDGKGKPQEASQGFAVEDVASASHVVPNITAGAAEQVGNSRGQPTVPGA